MNRIASRLLLAVALTAGLPAVAEECDGYAAHLRTCAPFVCRFRHPITRKPMQKEIVGIVAGKCRTTEQMPNNGVLECTLSPARQAAIASELRTLEAAKTLDAEGSIGAAGKARTTLKADGRRVGNALEDAANAGECRVAGY